MVHDASDDAIYLVRDQALLGIVRCQVIVGRITEHMPIHLVGTGIPLPQPLSIRAGDPALLDDLFARVCAVRFGDLLWSKRTIHLMPRRGSYGQHGARDK